MTPSRLVLFLGMLSCPTRALRTPIRTLRSLSRCGSYVPRLLPCRAFSTETPSISFDIVSKDDSLRYGKYDMIKSLSLDTRSYVEASSLESSKGSKIWTRGRIYGVRSTGKLVFLIIRSGINTFQACFFIDKKSPSEVEFGKFLKSIPLESIVDLEGEVVDANVKSCSIKSIEMNIRRCFIVSEAPTVLPFSIEDASHSQEEIDASQATVQPLAGVNQDLRFNNRWLDLRVPATNALFRIKSSVLRLFRQSLYNQGFMEINTPKIVPGESEGGAEVFRTTYFGKPACLAQSPQLYKQMAISGDMDKVFEVGPVFRAENSHTRRHLCEFIGLDIEMALKENYVEVLRVVHQMFRDVFTGLERDCAEELKVIRQQYPSEPALVTEKPLILHWHDAMELLREQGEQANDQEDLSSSQELVLGRVVRERYGSDIFMLDRYPSKVRPFYTMPSPINPLYSNSYDIFLRGQEICSGAQRCHDVKLLKEQMLTRGLDLSLFSHYLDSFEHGCPPHGGAGLGLERIVFLYLGLDNVRRASMFPRDPNRCSP